MLSVMVEVVVKMFVSYQYSFMVGYAICYGERV